MPARTYEKEARLLAVQLLERGDVGTRLLKASGIVGEALPVHKPEGGIDSLVVPVTVGDRLAGYFRFLPDLTLMGYSSFQRNEDSCDSCPESKLWLDKKAILDRFREKTATGEIVGEPVLTYDTFPARLAWGAIVSSSGVAIRKLYAAGHIIWESTAID
jgi:hypothetical protein